MNEIENREDNGEHQPGYCSAASVSRASLQEEIKKSEPKTSDFFTTCNLPKRFEHPPVILISVPLYISILVPVSDPNIDFGSAFYSTPNRFLRGKRGCSPGGSGWSSSPMGTRKSTRVTNVCYPNDFS
ncbi:hypothetical protein EVAR_6550_1 [Eumeta japonica]|uniref:Uncharacterized protein n=1 Tax=Eumeta variegata TaxID=151549 RepID=A0A4C1STH7_EUMVA|nr:hypothetical protein EVAR_6550_1 [Eumeta japonica]